MAERLDNYEFAPPRRPGGYAQYMDGQVWKLKIGEDIPSTSSNQRSILYTAAARLGLKARTSVDGDYLIVQAYKPEDER